MTTPTKNESLPELPELPDQDVDTERGDYYSMRAMEAYGRACYEAALTREAPTEGVGGDLAELIELSDRATELAERLVASGPKAAHVSASETHEIADFVHLAVKVLATPPAPQRMAQGEGIEGSADAMHWIDRYASGIDDECQLDRVAEALKITTQPPHQDRGEVDIDRIVRYAIEQHCPNGKWITGPFTLAMAITSDITAALTEAKQRGPGEAVCRACKGVGEVEGLVPHGSGDPQDDSWGVVPCATCNGTGEQANG